MEIQIARYKPESLDNLCKTTKFTKKELQIMYRGFKQVILLILAESLELTSENSYPVLLEL